MPDKRKAESSGKRARDGSAAEEEEEEEEEDGYSTSSSYAPSAIDVSFNYVAPSEIDFAALKRLVQQLYHTHAPDLDLGSLADHIIQAGSAQAGDQAIGTVVKVEDDEDGDPFAFASALNLSDPDSTAAKTLQAYYHKVLGAPANSSSSAGRAIATAVKSQPVVQIFHERMINMPPQIMPPLYRMLIEEINAHPTMKSASHFLLFSRVFSTDAFSDDDDDDEGMEENGGGAGPGRTSGGKAKSKKAKKVPGAGPTNQAIAKVSGAAVGGGADSPEDLGLFHPEDALFAKAAQHTINFRFPSVKDSDDSFNAPMYGRMVLINNDAKQIQSLLDEMAKAFAVPT